MPEIIVSLADTEIGRYAFDGDEITIGRSEGNDIRINNLSVSRRHAQFRRDGDRYILIDLDSANGAYVNGLRVARAQVFHDDKITVGKHTLRFLAPQVSSHGDSSDIMKTIVLDKSDWAPTLKVFAPNHRDARVPIAGEVTRIGRGRDNEVRLADWFVEMNQAEIRKEGSVFRLRNLSERHATLLNDAPIEEAFLSEGDIIQAGVSRAIFTLEAGAAAPEAKVSLLEEPIVQAAPLPFEEPPESVSSSSAPLGAAFMEDEEQPKEPELEIAPLDTDESLPDAEPDASPVGDLVEDEIELLETEEAAPLMEEESERGAQPDEIEMEEERELEPEPEEAQTPLEEEPALSAADRRAIAMWEKALENKSLAVRKQAAAQLKKLTGRDYAI